MYSLIFLTALAILAPTVTSLRCHSCPDSLSDDRCYFDESRYYGDQRKTDEECPPGNYMCGRASYVIDGKRHYTRGCINATTCSAVEYCKMDANKTRCKVDCCTWDLCNAAMNESPLKCYTCTNSHKYSSCNKGVTNCPSTDNLCLKVKTDDVYFKSCINEAGCKTLQEQCKTDDNCNAYCCSGNLCNSNIFVKSVLLVTALAPIMVAYLM